MTTYDAVVVGARCAGSLVAGQLARAGWSTVMVDKATFPSDTVSTHFVFPNTVARFAALGILARLQDRHDIPWLQLHWRMMEHRVAGEFTPIDGHTHGTSVRRVSLDHVLVEWAADAGVQTRFGTPVEALLGAGTDDDPVRGVLVRGGEEIGARWVIGADGRSSTVASLLGLGKQRELQGDQAYLMAYWRGLPGRDAGQLVIHDDRSALMWNPCEDGTGLLSYAASPEITRGSAADRLATFRAGVAKFPDVITAEQLDAAEMISDIVVVPETMMRGFYRQANGPGWALVGDAGHFKHPSTAQGISDAVEQAIHVAAALDGDDPELTGYEQWRNARSKGHYEWSFAYGTWPPDPDLTRRYFKGLSEDPAATQDFADIFTRLKDPSELTTPERLAAWFS